MPATRTPRKMTARELEAARARVRDQFFAPYQAAQQFGLQLPGMLQGIGKEALGAFRAGTEYVLDPNTQKDVPKDINRVGKAAAQNLGSYLDIFNSVYQAIDNEGMVAKPDYYRNLIGGMYQERFKPEPGDPRLERAASFYADPLALAGVGGRAARGLADPALYRQIADELGGANRAYAVTKAAVPSAKKQLFVTIGGAQYPVADMLDAARKYQMYRQQADVGASMLPPVDIVDEAGNVIANFSYNGRLWKGERGAADRVEIDPANYSE